MVPPAAQASSAAAATWTRQVPPAHPPALDRAAIAYNAAIGTAVLFGGESGQYAFTDTWTWDGTTWTRQTPAARPPPRYAAAVAYDAATGTAVLFGGLGGIDMLRFLGDTWTWDYIRRIRQPQDPGLAPPPRLSVGGTARVRCPAPSSFLSTFLAGADPW